MNPVQKTSAAETRAAAVALQSALDLDSIWRAARKLVASELPHRFCVLLSDFDDYEPNQTRYHLTQPRKADYVPAQSLSIAGPYLARHPKVELYTYSQIVSEDPDAPQRRLAQEPEPEWNEFVQLAFWRDRRPEAVLSVYGPLGQDEVTHEERSFLEYLHPMFDAGLRRLRKLEAERLRTQTVERYLQRMPLAVMFADAAGRVVHATAEGERHCERWNRALRGADAETSRLPEAAIVLAAAGQDAPLRLRHPSLPDLSVHIEASEIGTGLRRQRSYEISFEATTVASADGLSARALLALQQLTPAERRVAQLVARGLRNSEIAMQLCRSPRTVEFQLNAIYRKLDVSGRMQLICLLG